MLKWLRGGAADTNLPPVANWGRIAAEDLAVVFKHSTSCSVSWMADRQVTRFQEEYPDVPFYKVLVREQRPLSQELAQQTGVEHESPQVLVLRRGKLSAALSHGEVTSDNMAEAVRVAAEGR